MIYSQQVEKNFYGIKPKQKVKTNKTPIYERVALIDSKLETIIIMEFWVDDTFFFPKYFIMLLLTIRTFSNTISIPLSHLKMLSIIS